MTGGTSFIPSLRAIFERRFGAGKLHYDNPFQSVAAGLALLAADRRRKVERRAENASPKRATKRISSAH
jgi:molecular chaperone DnaK (HSP70)